MELESGHKRHGVERVDKINVWPDPAGIFLCVCETLPDSVESNVSPLPFYGFYWCKTWMPGHWCQLLVWGSASHLMPRRCGSCRVLVCHKTELMKAKESLLPNVRAPPVDSCCCYLCC